MVAEEKWPRIDHVYWAITATATAVASKSSNNFQILPDPNIGVAGRYGRREELATLQVASRPQARFR
jgi:hypothetical protein